MSTQRWSAYVIASVAVVASLVHAAQLNAQSSAMRTMAAQMRATAAEVTADPEYRQFYLNNAAFYDCMAKRADEANARGTIPVPCTPPTPPNRPMRGGSPGINTTPAAPTTRPATTSGGLSQLTPEDIYATAQLAGEVGKLMGSLFHKKPPAGNTSVVDAVVRAAEPLLDYGNILDILGVTGLVQLNENFMAPQQGAVWLDPANPFDLRTRVAPLSKPTACQQWKTVNGFVRYHGPDGTIYNTPLWAQVTNESGGWDPSGGYLSLQNLDANFPVRWSSIAAGEPIMRELAPGQAMRHYMAVYRKANESITADLTVTYCAS